MADAINFTNRTIKALVPPTVGRTDYRCSDVEGLYLRLTSKGIATFSFMGRVKGSRRVERVTIGAFPVVKPDEAIAQARVIAGSFARGESPSDPLRAKRRELTLGELFDQYLQAFKGKRPDYLASVWRLHLRDTWGSRKLSEITHAEVSTWHTRLPQVIVSRRGGHKPTDTTTKGRPPKKAHVTGTRSANQALQLMHTLFAWAIDKARIYEGANPAHGIDKFKEVSRERFLQSAEMGAFFAALAEEPNAEMRDFVMLALLTGARRNNILEMQWGQVDLARATWRIDNTKNGQPQIVALVPEAVGLLRERHASAENRGPMDWVLPANSKSGHLVEPKSGMKRLLEKSGLNDLRIHDLRRTLGSWQARTGASLPIIGKTLNHLTPASTAVYARLDLDPVREALETATAAMFAAAAEPNDQKAAKTRRSK